MSKRVFIIHGWGGFPEEGWLPWLEEQLEQRGFAVTVPAMPHAEKPVIKDWVSYLTALVGKPDAQTYFVGHSIGCQAIMRYLESLPAGSKVGGAVFVAGWFNLTSIETEEEKIIVKPWLETPIDFVKIKHVADKFVAIFSDNDPYVPLMDKDEFQEKLGAKIIVEEQKKHFSGVDGIVMLPSALDAVLKIAE